VAQVGAAKVEGKSPERKQCVLVPNGLYVGMLAGYSLPKQYPKYENKNEKDWKMFLWWVLTHDHTLTKLPNFSAALFGVPCVQPEGYETGVPKYFYNPDNGQISAYTSFVYAMRGGNVSKEEIVAEAMDYDLDEFVSRPAYLFIEQGKPNPETKLVTQRVKTITPVDTRAYNAVKEIIDNRSIAYTEESHLAYLESPKPVYLGEDDYVEPEVGSTEDLVPF
jgi:hypothetical protein